MLDFGEALLHRSGKVKKDAVFVTLNPFMPLSPGETRALVAASERYGAFLGLAVSAAFQDAS
jgi:hypothetical protein